MNGSLCWSQESMRSVSRWSEKWSKNPSWQRLQRCGVWMVMLDFQNPWRFFCCYCDQLGGNTVGTTPKGLEVLEASNGCWWFFKHDWKPPLLSWKAVVSWKFCHGCVTSSWPSVTCMAFVLLLRNQEMYIVGTSSNGTAKNCFFWKDHWSLSSLVSLYPKIWASVLSLPSYIAHRTCSLHTENLRTLPVCQVCFLAFAYLLCFCFIHHHFLAVGYLLGPLLGSYLSLAPMKCKFSYLAPGHFVPLRICKICMQHEYGNCTLSEKCGTLCGSRKSQKAAPAIKCSTSPSPLPLCRSTFTHHCHDYKCLSTWPSSGSHIGKVVLWRKALVDTCGLAVLIVSGVKEFCQKRYLISRAEGVDDSQVQGAHSLHNTQIWHRNRQKPSAANRCIQLVPRRYPLTV